MGGSSRAARRTVPPGTRSGATSRARAGRVLNLNDVAWGCDMAEWLQIGLLVTGCALFTGSLVFFATRETKVDKKRNKKLMERARETDKRELDALASLKDDKPESFEDIISDLRDVLVENEYGRTHIEVNLRIVKALSVLAKEREAEWNFYKEHQRTANRIVEAEDRGGK